MSDPMYAAISGLNASQDMLGVVGENIANVGTVGYKASSMTFEQALQQTLSGASAPTANAGGINPVQEAAGGAVNVGGVQINTNEGTLQSTGINTNLAIQGNGYFIVKTPQGGLAYTRAGNFTLDANGNLVDPNGDKVLGWAGGTIASGTQTATNMVPLSVPPNQTDPATASKSIAFAGNLSSADQSDAIPVTVYDSQGNQIPVTLTFKNSSATGGTSWTVGYSYQLPGSSTPVPPTGSTTIGTLSFANTPPTFTSSGAISITPNDGSAAMSITLNSGNFANLTDYAMTTQMTATADGNSAGTLQNFTIGSDGTITGSFSNGGTQVLGQVGLANFANAGGLLNTGNNLWQQSPNSGNPFVGTASSGELGSIAAGELEGSNVSLANEFVNMIVAQEGYQANSKVITVSQTLDTTLVNMVQ